jgi:hypothetical protein
MKVPFACALLLALGAGCARPTVPDPRVAARRFAEAAQRGDAAAIHAMLTKSAQREYGPSGTSRLVTESKAELARAGRALASDRIDVDTAARVRFSDGEIASLDFEGGSFKVSAAAGLPTGARTPAQALGELRQALARRSYPGLLRVLSRETQSAVENDLRSLVTGLEHPDALEIKVSGDQAEVTLPGGHMVRLKREAGLWKIDDFD